MHPGIGPISNQADRKETMMMDGRFDQQFAELFATSLADEGKDNRRASLWPLAAACIFGLAVFASSVVMG
jgi:hypothetical protein